MRQKIQQRKSEGFTIIEVMIVLAIAGLIILIVLLAVPALQRNSRNTQRKDAASQILTSVSNNISNNNGTLPANLAALKLAIVDYKPGFYPTANVYYGSSTPTVASSVGVAGNASTVGTENVIYLKGYTCGANNAPTTTGASSRSYVVVYAVESGSSVAEQCIGN